jgi:hypothetical protein
VGKGMRRRDSDGAWGWPRESGVKRQGETEHFCRVMVEPGRPVRLKRLMHGQWGMSLSLRGADCDSR